MGENHPDGLMHASMLWRRLDTAGHESARLVYEDSTWQLSGAAVFAYGGQPCRLDYLITCDSLWQTRSGRVTGWIGGQAVEVGLSAGSSGRGAAPCSRSSELERLCQRSQSIH